jgi:hypothetical protein
MAKKIAQRSLNIRSQPMESESAFLLPQNDVIEFAVGSAFGS